MLRAEQVTRGPGVALLMFGHADLAAELGCEPSPSGEELRFARGQLVLARGRRGSRGRLTGGA